MNTSPCYPRSERPRPGSAGRPVPLARLAYGDQRAGAGTRKRPAMLPEQVRPGAADDAESMQLGRPDAVSEGHHEADALRGPCKWRRPQGLDADPAAAQLP